MFSFSRKTREAVPFNITVVDHMTSLNCGRTLVEWIIFQI